jgi:hypothetical protein
MFTTNRVTSRNAQALLQWENREGPLVVAGAPREVQIVAQPSVGWG